MFETIELRQRRRLPSIDHGHLASVIDEIFDQRTINKCQSFHHHEIVFVGHNSPSRRHNFHAELIPVNGAGANLLAVEWACVDDQSLLDELVTAQQFDEGIARSALLVGD